MFQSWSSVNTYSNDGTNENMTQHSTYQDSSNKNLKHGLELSKDLEKNETNDMFYKIYKDDKKSKKMLGKTKNVENQKKWEIYDYNSKSKSDNSKGKIYNESYDKFSDYFNKFKITDDKTIEGFSSKIKSNKNIPDMKIFKNIKNKDINYEINKNKDVSNITLLNDNIKNIIEFDDFESIFNDPFFK